MVKNKFMVLAIAALAFVVASTGCAKKQVETDLDRDRTPPPAAVEPPEEPDEDAERAARENAMAAIGELIFFDFDKFDLKPEARDVLARKADVLRTFPEITVRIEGHADERGTVEYNLALGERRANAARQYLIDLGINADRLSIVSYGEERPLMQGQNEAAWSQNRRDEFIPTGG